MERVIEGKLLYLRMVKGETDPVYRRLRLQFEKLIEQLPKKDADIDYIASYTMEAFEKQFSTTVSFYEKARGEKEETDTPARFGAEAIICGKKEQIVVSRSIQEKLREVVAVGDSEALDNLKKKMCVARCRQNSSFWMVMKSRPQHRYASTAKRRAMEDISRYSDSEMADMLKRLVDSGFDLNSFEIQGGEECTTILSI